MENHVHSGRYRTRTIRLHPTDNVASALEALIAGEEVQVGDVEGSSTARIRVVEAIPLGHKFALASIQKGSEIKKHGVVIGHATTDISTGAWVSEHNLE